MSRCILIVHLLPYSSTELSIIMDRSDFTAANDILLSCNNLCNNWERMVHFTDPGSHNYIWFILQTLDYTIIYDPLHRPWITQLYMVHFIDPGSHNYIWFILQTLDYTIIYDPLHRPWITQLYMVHFIDPGSHNYIWFILQTLDYTIIYDPLHRPWITQLYMVHFIDPGSHNLSMCLRPFR